MAKNLVAGLVCVGLVAACGGGGADNSAAPVSGADTAAPILMSAQDAVTATPACRLSNWVAGQTYDAGSIVKFAADGKYYKATYENPGYDPTVSTWYWTPITVADWTAGQAYAAGDVVKLGSNGKYYQATYENPGYDPVVSTWFWSACSNPAPNFILTEAQFNQMFPNRNPFYTYAGLVDALNAFQGFAATGERTVRLQEVAAFLANVKHETGGLLYINELNEANWNHYCEASTQYPCAPGKQYYGRGPLQISWNYNYENAGKVFGVDLLNNPDLVAQDPSVAWKTALWFWMTMNGAGTMTGHNAIVNGAGFGETIRSINGALECGKPTDSLAYQKMLARGTYYTDFTQLLGVATGNNLTC